MKRKEDGKIELSWNAISFIEAPSSKLLLVALLSIVATVAAVITASFFIEINVSVKAYGEIDSQLGVTQAVAVKNGQLFRFPLKEGDLVKKDQVVGWLQMDQNDHKQVFALYQDLHYRVNHLTELKSLEPSIGESKITQPEIRGLLIAANQKLANLRYITNVMNKNSLKEIAPLRSRLNFVNNQLRYINNSIQKNYLKQQKAQLDDDKSRLIQQITSLENTITSRSYEARSDAEASIRAALTRVHQYITEHEIRSPVDGLVARVNVNEGANLKAGDEVATIVPQSAEMIAKVLVPSNEISRVEAGSKVSISVDAYPSHKFGYFSGEVKSIDLVKAQSGSSDRKAEGYVARISINTESIQRRLASIDNDVATKKVRLVPGMIVEAQILVRKAPLSTLAIDKVFGSGL